MVKLLSELKTHYCVGGVKAEFEAEGTRIEEAMRLKDVVSKAGLGLNIKIGGCEAIKDIYDARNMGAERIIGPMVETPYALEKFIAASKKVYADSIENVELLVNIETQTAYNNFSDMLKIPDISSLKGIVIGRVDWAGSLGLKRDAVNSEKIRTMAVDLAKRAKDNGLQVVIGGAVSMDSLPFFAAFPAGHIDRFETRKVIFDCPHALKNESIAFCKAMEFELLWLKNKKNYYSSIAHEDDERIKMMEDRHQKTMEKLREKEAALSI